MAGQGRRIRDPGPGRRLRPLPVGQPFQRGGASLVRDGAIAARPRLSPAVSVVAAPRILALFSPGEVRVAVVEGDDLLDYAIWRPGAPDGVGDLHRGRVTARVPALAGSFVALEGAADGFLPDSEAGAGLTEGALLGVKISRAAQGGKGPRLTARLTDEETALAASGSARLIRRGPGAVE